MTHLSEIREYTGIFDAIKVLCDVLKGQPSEAHPDYVVYYNALKSAIDSYKLNISEIVTWRHGTIKKKNFVTSYEAWLGKYETRDFIFKGHVTTATSELYAGKGNAWETQCRVSGTRDIGSRVLVCRDPMDSAIVELNICYILEDCFVGGSTYKKSRLKVESEGHKIVTFDMMF